MTRKFFAGVLLSCLLIAAKVNGQADFPNITMVYRPSLKSVLFVRTGFELSAPVIRLNSTEKLDLSFDDLSEEARTYMFTIRHCGYDWTTTPDLLTSEYINGMPEDEIITEENSFNTTVPYIHYSISFPTRDLQPKLSGNYLLIVWSDDPSRPDITLRFMVAEPSSVGVEAEITQPDLLEERFTGQQINFKVNMGGFPLMDARREVKVVVLQNDRWDNALLAPEPRFVRGNELDWFYDERNVFDGGNEFRGFDLKSLRYQTMRIRKIMYDTAFQVWLLDDPNRSSKNYIYESDINGRILIKSEDNAQRSELESDYAWVHFSFPSGPLPSGLKLYILGALTNWRMDESSEMYYNAGSRRFERALFLKQGYYNYLYAAGMGGDTYGDVTIAEGSHWETENQYMVLVYLREIGGLYDRLVAVQEINSRIRK